MEAEALEIEIRFMEAELEQRPTGMTPRCAETPQWWRFPTTTQPSR